MYSLSSRSMYYYMGRKNKQTSDIQNVLQCSFCKARAIEDGTQNVTETELQSLMQLFSLDDENLLLRKISSPSKVVEKRKYVSVNR